ncbi:unnamed protein product [Tilletia laevis]|uniref:Cleavage and polyadenylation specificity factor subunit 2 n=2 Tax=Tilletia TaxID=13289 RepID=A0ABN7IMQ5_9BASI|nr:hypothetical protein CF336_g3664 [Tilletia laevis]CAD6912199.1 unnamed protein product [Tilletia caries]CAD6947485.1 unnamed protein product [Tilletia laevis]
MITITPLAGPSARVVREDSADAPTNGDGTSGALVISSTGEAHPSSPVQKTVPPAPSSEAADVDAAHEREPPKVSAYLLQIDDIRVLVDCGSTEDFVFPAQEGLGEGKGRAKAEAGDAMETEEDDADADEEKKKQVQRVTELIGPLDEILERIAPTVDLLLLSHSTLPHLGLYAYARARLGLRCPVFATMPVQAMGKLTVLECTEALRAELDVEAENKRRVAAAAAAAADVTEGVGVGELGAGVMTTTTEPEKGTIPSGKATPAALTATSALSAGTTTAATLSQQLDDDERARAEAKAALKKALGTDVGKKRERCIPSVGEIEEAFEAISTVRYLQPTHLVEGKLVGMSLTAYSAGHSLGGTVWKIRSPLSGTILLALEYNHNRERHLDGTALLASSGAAAGVSAGGSTGGVLDAVRRADVLVTDVGRGLLTNAKRKDKDAALLSLIDRTLKSGNSLFFPVDPSARLLELLILFDQHWAYAYASTAPNPNSNNSNGAPPRLPLCLVSKTGKEMLQRARTFMEWMTREGAGSPAALAAQQAAEEKERNEKRGGPNQRRWGQQRDRAGPLEFRYLRVFTSIEAMDEVIPPNEPKVVLAVPPSLTHGPSRRLVQRFAEKKDDVIVLTHRGEPDSLARWLWNQWDERGEGLGKGGKGEWMKGKVGSEVGLEGVTYRLELLSEVPLVGDELRLYQEVHKASLEKTAQQRLVQARQRRTLEADEDDSDSDSDSGSEDDDDAFGELAGPGARGGGFAEPGSTSRKRVHAAAFGAAAAERGRGTAAMDAQNEGDGVSTTLSFDIYLKGNASRAAGGFFGTRANLGAGGEDGRSIRFRMFPFVERKRRVDAFGEVVDVGRWLNKQRAEIEKQAGTKATAPETEEQIKQRKILADRERARLAPPTKFSSEIVEVAFRCKLAFIEMEGLNDGKAHKLLIPQLFPRRLVLVNGDEPTRQDMLDSMLSVKGFTKEITAPTKGVTVRIGELTHSFTVNLGDGILQALKMSRFEDYEMAHVTARVTVSADSAIPTLELIGPNGVIALSDVVDTAAIEAAERNNEAKDAAKKVTTLTATASAEEGDEKSGTLISKAMFASAPTRTLQPTLFIGDLRLSVLKSILARDFRIPSEFAGEGMLVCGTPAMRGAGAGAGAGAPTTELPTVTVQKEGEGRVVLEGNVGPAFYAVRRAVFGLHAQVSE